MPQNPTMLQRGTCLKSRGKLQLPCSPTALSRNKKGAQGKGLLCGAGWDGGMADVDSVDGSSSAVGRRPTQRTCVFVSLFSACRALYLDPKSMQNHRFFGY